VTNACPPIAEEDLHAYVDGFLGERRWAEVDRYLEDRPEIQQRVAAYMAQRSSLRAMFSALGSDPVPPRLNLSRLLEERLVRRRASRVAIAAAIVGLTIGGAGGWLVGSRPPDGIETLSQEAAASYTVYATDQRHPVELAAGQRDELSRWLSSRLNHRVAPPDLSVAGYALLGGRLVASQHGPAALFMYERSDGARLAIYMRLLPASQAATPLELVDVGEIDGCAWIDGGVGYSLIAAEPYRRLLELSHHVRQEIRSRG
jgi:anti-sigma factor RsiW